MNEYEAPERIWLQVDPDGLCPGEWDSLDGATWCADKINDNDVEYVRADTVEWLKLERDELLVAIEELMYALHGNLASPCATARHPRVKGQP